MVLQYTLAIRGGSISLGLSEIHATENFIPTNACFWNLPRSPKLQLMEMW